MADLVSRRLAKAAKLRSPLLWFRLCAKQSEIASPPPVCEFGLRWKSAADPAPRVTDGVIALVPSIWRLVMLAVSVLQIVKVAAPIKARSLGLAFPLPRQALGATAPSAGDSAEFC